MIPVTLGIKPNVDTVSTPFQSMGQITASNLIRFFNSQIQKLGGCAKLISAAFSGVATALMPWAALNQTQYIGIGTTTRLQLISGGVLTNITPAGGVGSGDWSLDKWGQDLIAAPAGGTIYDWVPPVSGGNIAVAITNAPSIVNGLVVAAPEQQIIAWGAYSATLAAQDPMLVAWCDVADFTTWTAAVANQAGTFRIPNGSKIVAILWPGLSGILWTDLDVWAVTYVNYPLVYGFNMLARNAGLIARRAVALLGQRIPWMSQNTFYVLQGGTVQELPCSVRNFVFGPTGLDRAHVNSIHADPNSYFNEVTWWFPIIGSAGVCTAYVKATWSAANEVSWDYGTAGLNISAWSDQSVIGAPIGADYAGLVQQFETAIDWNGVPFDSGFTSGWFDLQEGEVNVFVERIMPDFTINPGGQISLTVTFADEIPQNSTDYPVRIYGPYIVTAATPFIIVRGSGRVASLTVSCTVAGTTWTYGKPIARVSPDGHR
jgi:hypothetical protein